MSHSSKEKAADFGGNREQLEQFLRLVASRIRSEERAKALEEWSDYKKALGSAYVRENKSSRHRAGPFTKSDYIRSLTAPAIDLRGATIQNVCLGYVDLRGAILDGARFLPASDDSSSDGFPWVAFKGAKFQCASLQNAYLQEARLLDADLSDADLSNAELIGADLSGPA